jgi:chromosomal replication initiator protein
MAASESSNGPPGRGHGLPQRLYDELRERVQAHVFDTWFRDTPCSFREPDTFVLTAQNNFRRSWIKNKFSAVLADAAREVLGVEPRLVFLTALRERAEIAGRGAPGADILPQGSGGRSSVRGEVVDELADFAGRLPPPPGLNPDSTFENFVVGPTSQLAHAAALAVAEHPGKSYNPLLIYGREGVGKTHLLQAIGHFVAASAPLRQLYFSAESFAHQYAQAAEQRSVDSFRQACRGADILLLDGLHFLAGRPKTQAELLQLAEFLIDQHRQIVLSSARPAEEVSGLDNRLAARLRGGLSVQLQGPPFEIRVRIALHRARLLRQELPVDAAEAIAGAVQDNLWELDGAVKCVLRFAHREGQPPTVKLVQRALEAGFSPEPNRPVSGALTLDTILEVVQEYYSLKPKELLSRSKVRYIAQARQLAMYLARELTALSLEQIGVRFGGRDHSTVVHAQKRIRKLASPGTQLHSDLCLLRARLAEARDR